MLLLPIWLTTMDISAMAFSLKDFNFNQSVACSQRYAIKTMADIINSADLGFEVMHERDANNCTLDLALGDELAAHKVISNV